jgi:hypothetical protein
VTGHVRLLSENEKTTGQHYYPLVNDRLNAWDVGFFARGIERRAAARIVEATATAD